MGLAPIYRLILAPWAADASPYKRKVLEGQFTQDELAGYNEEFYNIYYLPNYPKEYDRSKTVDGSMVDTFEWVYIDMDLKDEAWPSKEVFVDFVANSDPKPTKIIDSGNGVHCYYRVTDLDAFSFLKLQRRLCRKFVTDEAVAKIYQLMRVPGFVNTKKEDGFSLCQILQENEVKYTCEELDRLLPIITKEDENYCKAHHDKTYRIDQQEVEIDEKIPLKFCRLIQTSPEAKQLWAGDVEDRSKSDYRLAHLMFADNFTKEEAASVLVNTSKALERAPIHRISYAMNIIDKIWTFEFSEDKTSLLLSKSVKDIIASSGTSLKGAPFRCHRYIDATHHGFRLGQVIGLVAGSGVGKTAMALNMFEGFVKNNPDYEHFFVPLEQPSNEIADRWKTMCGTNTSLHDKVHVISNYNEDGSFRHLSLSEIKDYLIKFREITGKKIGCVVIDHIGALKKKSKDGENQGIIDICHEMKAFAIQTNTMLVMQSQSAREKSGIGDLELNKDAAYGTVFFESYCDYLITIWQPVKRCYSEDGCLALTAFKFCKIRHKKKGLDEINEDVPYLLRFDTETEHFSELTQDEETQAAFFIQKATNLRKQDRKTDVLPYKSITWDTGDRSDGKTSSNQDSSGI